MRVANHILESRGRRAHTITSHALSKTTQRLEVGSTHDLLCLSHLRWNFVHQRPQHLMTRFARERRVFFFEEPIFTSTNVMRLDISEQAENLWIVVPVLPEGLSRNEIEASQRTLLNNLLE